VDVDTASILGEEATLFIHLGPAGVRTLHGIVASFDHWDAGSGPDRHRYKARIVPRLWKLNHRVQSRIFQNMAVPEIVTKVLDEGRVELRSALSRDYAKRDTCIQYRESDLELVSRLLAEEGILYWFEHEQGKHTMVLADSAHACPNLPGDPRIVFREQSGMVTEEHVDSFLSHREVRPTAVTLRDFNYLTPGLDLTVTADEGGEELEIYD
jgi:type VI secretion system secreted protein VgrG